MTDTISCPHCSASVPSGAAFCTSCGQPLGMPAAPAADGPADDTRVDTPGLHDATQVQPAAPPPPSPFAPPPPPAAFDPATTSPSAGPWGPGGAGAPHAAPPAAPPSAPPWTPPEPPPPATWQQPQASPPGASYDPAASPPIGGQPWDSSAPPAWGTPAPVPPATEAKRTKSPIGGIVALIGAIVAIVGVFSGWVTLDPGSNSETVTGWSLTVGEGLLKSSDPYLIVGLAAVAVVLAILLFAGVARVAVRIVTILVGLGIVGVAIANWMSIASFVTDNLPESFEATGAIGFYLAIAGGVLVAIAGLMPAKK